MDYARGETMNHAIAWHALDAATALERLESSAEQDLAAPAVAQRGAEHGPNGLPEPPARSVLLLFLRQFKPADLHPHRCRGTGCRRGRSHRRVGAGGQERERPA